MLLTVRALMSAEWPEGVDGRYYWEHCEWIDRDDFTSNGQMGLAVINDLKLLYTSQVQFHSTRWFDASDMSLFFQQTYSIVQHGSLSPSESPNLLMCARWRMHGDDGSYTYHMHRAPVGNDDLIGGVWSDDGYIRQSTHLNTYVDQGIYRTQTGSLITSGTVAQLPVMWQMRHGTKRRQSRFWLS